MGITKAGRVLAAVAALGLLAAACTTDDDQAATETTATTAGDVDLEGTVTLDELVDIAFLNVDRVEFCQAIADTAGSPELQYEVFAQGFANSGEEFGYSTREVFDARVARC